MVLFERKYEKNEFILLFQRESVQVYDISSVYL